MKHIARTQMSKIAEQMQREFDEVLARMSGVSTNDDNVNNNNNNNNQEQDDEETDTDNNKPKKSGREKLLDDLTKAIEANPAMAEAYYYRGLLKETLEDNEGALRDWGKAAVLGHKEAAKLIK